MKYIFTPEQDQFIRENLKALGTRKIGAKYGVSKTLIRRRCLELGLQDVLTNNSQKSLLQKGHKLGVGKKISPLQYEKMKATMFKKGQKPQNIKEIGYKRFHKDGYSQIKTENGFELEQRVIWRKHFGEIPDSHVIIFKDKDITNLNIENLECISKDENCIINFQTGKYPRKIQKLDYTRVQLERKIKQHYGKK